MIKFISSLSLFFISSAFAEGKKCSVTVINEYTQSINFGGRTIHLIGWSHLTTNDYTTMTSGLQNLENEANLGNCSKASQMLSSLLTTHQTVLSNSSDLYSRLEQANNRDSFTTIGVESSYIENRNDESYFNNLRSQFQNITSKCPDLAEDLNPLRTAFIGATRAFAEVHTAKVEGIESHLLRQQSFRSLSEDVNFFFGGGDGMKQVSTAARPMIFEILRKIDAGESFSNTLIDSAVRLEPQPELAVRLNNALRDLKRINELSHRRNAAIARNIMHREGSYAVVLGQAHIPDLISRIRARCLSKTSSASNTTEQTVIE